MHTTILDLLPEELTAPQCKRVLSFRPFVNFIKDIRDKTSSHKKYYFSYVIEQFEKYPEFVEPADINRLKDYEELMQLVYNSLSSMVEDENVNYWALCTPL